MSTNTDLVVLATASAKPGAEEALLAALRDVAAPTRAQPGCRSFELLRSRESPGVVIAIERWASAADHARHLQGAHVARLMTAMTPLLAAPPVISACESVG